MNILVVLAHPLPESFAAQLAKTVRRALESAGHSVDLMDLYGEDFDPRLTRAERGSYFADRYDHSSVEPQIARLRAADGIIMVFPQWWYSLPAILKGFIDRVFVPGVAFGGDAAGGGLVPKLDNIKYFWAITTTGSPWWIVQFYMGNPVKRILKRGVAAFCCQRVDFRMLSLHNMDKSTPEKCGAFLARVHRAVSRIG